MFYILIVVNITLQWSVCSHSLSEENRINDRLSVNCIIDGRNNVFIGCPVIMIKIVKDSAIIRCLHIIACITILICKGLRILWCQQCKIQFSGLHLDRFCIIIRYDLKNDLVDIWCTLEIILVLYQCDRLSRIPAV